MCDLPAGGLDHRAVRGDEQHPLALAVLGGEPLEQRVGMGDEANRERTELGVVAHAVEDDDAARALRRDEARERVRELARIVVRTGVQQVEAVEQVEVASATRCRRAS